LREISSLNIRIAKEVPGIGERVLPHLVEGGQLQNTLILSPPGGGKTTLLRDLIRCISDGTIFQPLRVGVADERGELAAMEGGRPQLELGGQTDVMDHCPKDRALLILLRGMNPQVLAADEITDPEDSRALELAVGCGVTVLATAHGARLEDLQVRPVYHRLLQRKVFRKVIVIEGRGEARRYRVVETEGGGPLCCV
jgi:stage III sporulation protein AA